MQDWRQFEIDATNFLSKKWGVPLSKRDVLIGGVVPKEFDMVSDDETHIGDAKFLKNIKDPAAKFQGISEYVWLLQQAGAKHKFMVFGRDREIPERWLGKYRPLVGDVVFYFFDGANLDRLN